MRRWPGNNAFDLLNARSIKIAGVTITGDSAVAALSVHNATGGTLSKGALVYLNGWDATAQLFTAAKADADAAGKHATHVVLADIANGADGEVSQFVELTGLNTNAGNVGDPVYLSATAGGWTLTAPTAYNAVVQVVGYVSVKNASTGKVQFTLAGAPFTVLGANELQPGSVLEASLDPSVSLGLNALRVCHSVYDFATDTGATGTLALRGGTIPDKAIIYGGLLNVNTALTTSAGATAALQANAANDIVNAAVVSGAPWSSAGIKAIIPVMTAATAIKTTAARTPSLVIGTGALTAGHFNLDLLYFVTDAAN